MTALHHKKCMAGMSDTLSSMYAAAVKVEWPSGKVGRVSHPAVTGVGTVLSSVLKYIGIESSPSCACARHAREMDQRGPQWCLDNIDTIVEWLRAEASIRGLLFSPVLVKLTLKGLLRGYMMLPSTDVVSTRKTFPVMDADVVVAITAAPRKEKGVLSACLSSLVEAGWYDFVIFAEPGTDVPEEYLPFVEWNETRKGCYHNWLHSARWATSKTNAKYILTVQDDAVFHPDTRMFVEKNCLWPTDDTGVVSLYVAPQYSVYPNGSLRPPGINEVFVSDWWGTLAVVWKPEVLKELVESQAAKEWLGLSPKARDDERYNPALRSQRVEQYYQDRRETPHNIANSDYLAGTLLNKMGRRKFFVDPSPVQHIARSSTIGHGDNNVSKKRNCGRCAVHTVPLEHQTGAIINLIDSDTPNMVLRRGISPKGIVSVLHPKNNGVAPPPHVFMIRTSYADPAMGAYRWRITKETLLPSLAKQTYKNFKVVLVCGSSDPLQQEKVAAFSSVCQTEIASEEWFNAPHTGEWRRVTRVDDDDILAIDFAQRINDVPFEEQECILSFPNGVTWVDDTFYRWVYPENQFLTLQTNTALTPYHFAHQYYRLMVPTVVVDTGYHWVWVRHHGVLSGHTPGNIPARFLQGKIPQGVDPVLFPYDWDRIKEAIAYDAPAVDGINHLRAKHGRVDKDVLDIVASRQPSELTDLASKYGTDKGVGTSKGDMIAHQYTLVYDRLFSPIKDSVKHVLEFGIGEGASLRMWADYFPNATIHGLDIKRRVVPHPRIVTNVFNATRPLDTHFRFDILIDDASHISSHQRKQFALHSRLVKPGGFYVIEDLQVHRLKDPKWIDEQVTMLETCREWVKNPPEGWTCMLYGDQLCILRRNEDA